MLACAAPGHALDVLSIFVALPVALAVLRAWLRL